MKIKLTPQLSYLAGITKYVGVSKGIGVSGSEPLHAAFASAAIEAGVAVPQKLALKGKTIRVYHSTYESYIYRVQSGAVDKFKHMNEYAASYLAGIFDAVGGVATDSAYLSKCDKVDEVVLDNLGFRIKLVDGKYWIGHHEQFLKFISKFRRVDDAYLKQEIKRE